jgi:diguanylate cyclase (GGDEF)-like protein
MNARVSAESLPYGSSANALDILPTAKSLTKVLGQSEHALGLVDECAENLGAVKIALKQELADGDPSREVEDALKKSEAAESKAQDASEKLSCVNQALEVELKARHGLEKRLAIVTELEETARYASFHDPLTDLPNRALFENRLEHGLVQAYRHGWGLAVMFVDLNNFKTINDSFGHSAGDDVLRTIGQRLQDNARGGDTISRYGGDEFLCLLMEIHIEQDLCVIAKKMIQSIQKPIAINTHGVVVPMVTASVGISIYPKHGTTVGDLIKSADMAMYQAKRNSSEYAFAE